MHFKHVLYLNIRKIIGYNIKIHELINKCYFFLEIVIIIHIFRNIIQIFNQKNQDTNYLKLS
jgi:hypothetical protein